MYQVDLSTSHFPIQDSETIVGTTVGGLLRHSAAVAPSALALAEIQIDGRPGRRWTFAGLLADAERMALALSTRFQPGDRICVWAPNVPEWVLMEYACALAGLTLVTANPAYQVSELRYILEQSGAVGLFHTLEYRGNPMADIAAQAVQDLQGLREVADIEDWDMLMMHGDRAPNLPDVAPQDAAQIQYTSGTTGFPKGAVLGHLSVTNNARFYMQRLQARTGAPYLNMMPLFHTAGCGMGVLGALQTQSPLFLPKIFDPVQILRLIGSEKIELTGGVPTMMVAMLQVLQTQTFDVSSLTNMMSGGSMVAPDLVRKVRDAFGCAFQTVYGQTECSPLLTQHHMDEAADDISNTVGQPMPQTEMSIRSTDKNAVQPIGEIGEICARGYCKMIGYNDNPNATAAAIDDAGWLHTGDLGTMDARGYLRVTGRVKEMIIRGGENLFPAEIENALLDHPDVAEVAVVGVPDEKWGEVVAAFVRPSEGVAVDTDVLKTHCRQRLAAQKTPAIWSVVEQFPLTGSGKIQKFALRDGFLKGDILAL